jgi:hypothetical protein
MVSRALTSVEQDKLHDLCWLVQYGREEPEAVAEQIVTTFDYFIVRDNTFFFAIFLDDISAYNLRKEVMEAIWHASFPFRKAIANAREAFKVRCGWALRERYGTVRGWLTHWWIFREP